MINDLRAQSDMTIMLTTHYLDEAERLCDRVAIVHTGRIVALDTPEALLASLGREIVEVRVHDHAEVALASLRTKGIAGDDAFSIGSTVTVPWHDGSAGQAMSAIADIGLPTAAISTRQPTLDDVYLRLTGDRLAA